MTRATTISVKRSTPNRTATIMVMALFLISTVLAFVRLDNAYLWDDEAQVALIARNLVTTGQYSGWDGRNLFGYHDGALLDANLRPINAPLDFLLTAASFKLFGVSTWAARLPFVIAGLLSLLVYWKLAVLLSRGVNRAVVYACGLYALSTVFLLYIRTCRYFSPALLFSLLTLYAYYRCRETKKPVYYVVLALSAALLFYTQYLVAATFFISLGLIHVLFNRKEFRGSYAGLAGAAGLFLLLTIPYAVHFHIWRRPDLDASDSHISRFQFIHWHLEQLLKMGCFSPLILAAFYGSRHAESPFSKTILPWTLFAVAYVTALGVLLPHPISVVRYLAPLMPMCYLLTGMGLAVLDQRSRLIAMTVAIVMTCTTLLSFGNSLLLPGYVKEITHPYPTGNEAVATYLKKNARQDDTVNACPEYLNYPLMFYVGDRVRVSNLLDESTPLPKDKVRQLAPFLFRETTYPNWFIAFGKSTDTYDMPGGTDAHLAYYARPHVENGKSVTYRYRLVTTLDAYWEQTQRPEVTAHSYGPVAGYDPATSAIYIYHREPARASR